MDSRTTRAFRILVLVGLLGSAQASFQTSKAPKPRRPKQQQQQQPAWLARLSRAPPPPPPPSNAFLAAFGSSSSSSKKKKSVATRPALPQALLDVLQSAPVEAARSSLAEIRPLQVFSGFMLAVVLAGSSVVATGNAVSSYLARDGNGQVLERALLFGTILDNVKAAYVDGNIDIEQLFETGVNAMLAVLDPYSVYENPKEADDLSVRTSGRYGGVGLTIGKDGDDVLVLGALEGYAYDAGVRAGDRILAVDGQDVKPLEVDEVKNLLRGEPGTSIQLKVSRDGSPTPDRTLVMPVQRRLIRLPDVTLATLSRGVGYLKIEGFSEGTAEETARAIKMLQDAEGPDGMKALVIDLRDNPGGLLDAAVAVSQQLVTEGTEIVSTAGRVYGEGTSLSYRSMRPPLLNPRTRLVVIVNSNTASAAEIVAGVVQDTDRGLVVGERTYGKGLVQVVEPLPGGGSLKLTVAKYYTPSGRCIQAISYAGGRVVASAANELPTILVAPNELPAILTPGTRAPADAGAPTSSAPPAGAATITTSAADPAARQPSSASASAIMPATSAVSSSASASFQTPRARASAAARPKPGPDSPGALLRIDPTEPSKPGAALADTQEYFTTGGRRVRGGGGIGPDVQIEGRKVGELERSLIQKGLFFQFATDWLQRHAAPTEQLAQTVERTQETTYGEFVSFVRQELTKNSKSLEPLGLQKQLDALQQSMDATQRVRSAKELQVLRERLGRLRVPRSASDYLGVPRITSDCLADRCHRCPLITGASSDAHRRAARRIPYQQGGPSPRCA